MMMSHIPQHEIPDKRTQLTIFIAPTTAANIEVIRQRFNPAQYDLIRAHITLCRDEELNQITEIIANLQQLNGRSFEMELGKPIRFDQDRGILIPVYDINGAFHNLRKQILAGIVETPKIMHPHITLIHPRNGYCNDDIAAQITKMALPKRVQCQNISLIEQLSGGKWCIIQQFDLY